MTIGIWGGFIGRNLLATLVEKRVRDLCLLTRGQEPAITVAGVEIPTRQITFEAGLGDMADVLAGVSVLVHAAGTSNDGYVQYLRAATHIAEAAGSVGVRRVILISTVAVYGAAVLDGGIGANVTITKDTLPQPQSLYAQSRYSAENEMRRIFQNAGVEFVVVRIPMAVGPGMNAMVFKRLSALLALRLYPNLGGQQTYLPCIGIQRLRHILTSMILAAPPLGRVYQFSDQLFWEDVVRLCDRKPTQWKMSLPIQRVHAFASYFGLSTIASSTRSMLNTACYADDSEEVLAGSVEQWPTYHCVVNAATA